MSISGRTVSAVSAVLAAALTCAAGASPASAAARPFSLIPGLLAVSVHSGKCLVADDGNRVVQRGCGPDPAFRWRLVPVSLFGWFHIENEKSGKCLTIAGGGRQDNGLAVQDDCDAQLSRNWSLADAPGTGIYVENVNSGKCLTVAGGGVGDNDRAEQYRCDGEVSRRWSFRLTPGGAGVVTVNGGRP